VKAFMYFALTCLSFPIAVMGTCMLAGVHPWIAGAVAVFAGGCYAFGMGLTLTSKEGPNWKWPVNAGIVGVCSAFAYLLGTGTVVW
jgi:hypothetical protein